MNYTVGAALERMALLDVEAVLDVVATVEREADAGASEVSQKSQGVAMWATNESTFHYSRLTTSGITCRDRAQGVSGTAPLAATSMP